MQKVNSWCNIAGFLCLKSDNNAGFLALNVVQQNHLYSNKLANFVGQDKFFGRMESDEE